MLDVTPSCPLKAPRWMRPSVAHWAGESWVPWLSVYLYGSCRNKPNTADPSPTIRSGGYEGVASRISDPLWKAGLRSENARSPQRESVASAHVLS